ncbi:DUF1189 domain-containing protein [bacterium]|nr:DUF1189 domain-containing protein [bacterium]NCQ54820.1 DUF1189 domain-containing protein [Candidatus Parcubacteria bacterium]NCS66864.1 DUF1189 domain-containing protein [Candidatus Peregrinibacteria bacterium]NCS95810.1 DUF1189 domain-containing protein [bacterium]
MKKQTPEIVIPKINVWARMAQVWTNPNFIQTVLYAEKEKAVSRTWVFWFVWNSLISVVATVAIWFLLAQNWVNWLENDWWNTVPEFEASVTDGVLSTNLPEPYIIYEDEEFIAVIDTQEITFSEASLEDYAGGLVVTADKMVVREDTGEYRSFNFSEIEEDFSFTKMDVQNGYYSVKPTLLSFAVGFMFVCIWIWLSLIRLISAAWWALVFWGVGVLAKIPDWSYGKSYLSVLNFYVIVLAFESILLLLSIGVLPFSSLLVFGLVFGVNFYSFKNELEVQ